MTGEKHWQVRPPVVESPLRDQPWTDHRDAVRLAADGPPVVDAVLTPGDCLYVPRGWLHSATALGGTSIHLTMGVHVWTRRQLADDLLRAAGRRLDDDPAVRAALDVGVDPLDPALAAGLRDGIRAAVEAALDAVTDDELAAALAQRCGPRSGPSRSGCSGSTRHPPTPTGLAAAPPPRRPVGGGPQHRGRDAGDPVARVDVPDRPPGRRRGGPGRRADAAASSPPCSDRFVSQACWYPPTTAEVD